MNPNPTNYQIKHNMNPTEQTTTTQTPNANPETPATPNAPLAPPSPTKPEVLDAEYSQAITDVFEIIGQSYDLSENKEVFDLIRKTFSDRLAKIKPRVAPPVTTGKKAKQPRPIIPYNLYISHRFAENKKAPTSEPTTELMSKFSKEWDSLPQDKKQPFIDLADSKNLVMFPDKVKKTKAERPMNGYNFYLKKHSAWFKTTYPTLSSADRMSKVGECWTALGAEEKKKYTEDAIEFFNAEQIKVGKPVYDASAKPKKASTPAPSGPVPQPV